MGTENSQLPHWLIVSVEKDGHRNQGIAAVSLAESAKVCEEVRPLQEGLGGKKRGMRAVVGPSVSDSKKAFKVSLHLDHNFLSIRKISDIYCAISQLGSNENMKNTGFGFGTQNCLENELY